MAATVTRPWSGQAILLLNGQERWRKMLALMPGQPFRHSLALSTELPAQGHLVWRLVDQGGRLTAEYATDFHQDDS
jgi:hypothetical protein